MSREIWAFHCSTGSCCRKLRLHRSPSMSISCSGSGSETPPRAASRFIRSSPTSRSRSIIGSAVPASTCLHALVVEPGAAADPGPHHVDVGALAGAVDLDRPQQRRPLRVGQQRGGALGEHGRVQRHLGVGAVERLAATVRLDVDGVAGADEGRHVGDGVVHEVALAVTLDVQRLVEVHRPHRVDRHERDLGAVELRQPRARRCGGRSLLHLRREGRGHPELVLDGVDPVPQRVTVGVQDPHDSSRHCRPHPSRSETLASIG